MVSCAVRSCSSRNAVDKKKTTGITFHRFPKNSARSEVWEKFVNRGNWKPTKHSVLCSKHFSDECFDRTSKSYMRLRPDAIPSLSQDETVAPRVQKLSNVVIPPYQVNDPEPSTFYLLPSMKEERPMTPTTVSALLTSPTSVSSFEVTPIKKEFEKLQRTEEDETVQPSVQKLSNVVRPSYQVNDPEPSTFYLLPSIKEERPMTPTTVSVPLTSPTFVSSFEVTPIKRELLEEHQRTEEDKTVASSVQILPNVVRSPYQVNYSEPNTFYLLPSIKEERPMNPTTVSAPLTSPTSSVSSSEVIPALPKLLEKLHQTEEVSANRKRKLILLRRQVARKDKIISTMKNIISDLKKKINGRGLLRQRPQELYFRQYKKKHYQKNILKN